MKGLLILILVLLVAWAFDTPAQPFPFFFDYALKGLDLTKDQREKIAELDTKYQKAVQELRIQLERKILDLRAELIKDEPDPNRIRRILEEMAPIDTELKFLLISRGLELKGILTQRQWDRVMEERYRKILGKDVLR
ncbi:MAG: Spy/CpxP family protein refolding chaperone [bacterium]